MWNRTIGTLVISASLVLIACEEKKSDDGRIVTEPGIPPVANEPSPIQDESERAREVERREEAIEQREEAIERREEAVEASERELAERRNPFDEWDDDNNRRVDAAEFRAHFNHYYRTWNQTGEGMSANELGRGIFAEWDDNRDGMLTNREVGEYADDWFGRDLVFEDWDRNNDGSVSREEYLSSFENAGFFEDYDEDNDGQLNDLEASGILFNYWDRDGNDIIDDFEWRW